MSAGLSSCLFVEQVEYNLLPSARVQLPMVDDPSRHGLQDVLYDVLRGLTAALDVRRAAALLVDEGRTTCRAAAAVGLTDSERRFLEEWLTHPDHGRAYWDGLPRDGRPVYVGTRPGASPPPPTSRFRPHLAVPLVGAGGRLLGMIGVETDPPSDHEVEVAAAIGRVAAIAIEQTATAAAHAAQLFRNAALLEIVREVDRRLDLPDVLAAICRKTVETFGCQATTVFFHSRRHRAALPLADYGTPPHVAARYMGSRYGRGNIPHEQEVGEGRTILIGRARAPSPDDVTLLDVTEVDALVMIPLRGDDGSVRGVLSVGFREREPSVEEIQALEVVAHHASTAIMRARFLHATTETARYRAAVSALAVELNAATSRSQSLQLLCTRGAELFGVGAGVLLVQTGQRLLAEASWGAVPLADAIALALDGDAGPVARAIAEGQVVHESDLRRTTGPLLGLRSLLAIPVVEADGRAGALVFGDPRPRRFQPSAAVEAGVLGAMTTAVLRNVELLGRLHDSNERLRRVSTLKDQFLANVSHDLRTPLNVIIGYAQLALEDTFGGVAPELRDILERMLTSARQQLALVQDLLDLSRLELHGLTVKPTSVAVAPVFADMEFLVTSLVRDKPVRIAVDPVPLDLWVHADPNRLRQVLTNLLSNATKFTDVGTVGLRAVAEGDTVTIDVWDTGIGIPPAAQEAIFEPFRQVDGDRAALGTGLGLAIARRLSELMGGTLDVDSAPGRGSTFRLTLAAATGPVRRVVASAAEAVAQL